MQPIVELKNISLKYQSPGAETEAIKDVSLKIYKGEFISIVGPSGCGKSTLLSIISGLLSPSGGQIIINNDITTGYMLQKDHLLEWRRIFDNMCLGLEIRGINDKKHQDKIRSMMKTYGLAQFSDSYPSSLSGGMRQRAALIRTLALEPELLLLDEPFSALDYLTRLEVGDDIGQIIRNTGKTAILVTHDLSEAISLADRIIVLTGRPGTVKSMIDVQFPEKVRTSLQRRNSPEFSRHFNRVWTALKNLDCEVDQNEEKS